MTESKQEPGRRPGTRLVVTLAGLFLAGAAVLLALWLSMPAGEETAGAESASSGGSSSAQASEDRDAPRFPDRYDHLGVALGPEDAPVTVREFGDYQCPACGQFAPAAERLREEYVGDGRVRFIFFDFPLTSMHDNALTAAEAARCAGEQGDYWAMHDALFDNQASWSGLENPVPEFREYAAEHELDGEALAACIAQDRTREAVMESLSFGQHIGVRSTPTVVVNSTALPGVPSYQQLEAVVRRELDKAAR